MFRAEVGRQGRLDVVPGIFFSAIIWKLRQQSRQVVGPMQRLCGCVGVLEHVGHSTFLPLLSHASEHRHLPLAQGKVGEEPGSKRTGLNLDERRVWGPKTEPRIWHPKGVPPLLPAFVSVRHKRPKNGGRKTVQGWASGAQSVQG